MANRAGRASQWALKKIVWYYYEILGIFAVITFCFGWIGFSIAPLEPTIPAGFFDTVYYSLQLFVLEYAPGAAIPVDNFFLGVARFFAPVLTALSFLALVLSHFMNRYLLTFYLKRIADDHVVICGLGYVGPEIASMAAKAGRTVVVIEKDTKNPGIEICRDNGVFVLIDDAAQTSVLQQVQVHKAGDLFVVTGDDARNLGIAYKVKDSCATARVDLPPLHAYCHIGDSQFCSTVRGKAFLTAGESNVILEPFNIYQIAGYCLTKEDKIFERFKAAMNPTDLLSCGSGLNGQPTPDNAPDIPPAPEISSDLHILIIGIGRMGEALLVRLARKWRELNDGKTVRVTIVDGKAETRRDALQAKYVALDRYADITWIQIQIDTADSVLGNAELMAAMPSVTHIYYCIDNPSIGLSMGLTLSEKAAPGSITRIRSLRRSELSPLIDQLSASLPECRRIQEFHITSCPCCLDIMRWGISEQMARLNHEVYLQSQYRIHGKDVKKKNVVPWEELVAEKKDSNREQALDLGRKLKGITYTVAPLTDWDEPLLDFAEIPFSVESTALETMARWEHERWMAEMLRKGWKYADIPEQNPELKLHPDIKPYDDLSPTVQEYDRDYIRSIPRTLCRMDLKLVPAEHSDTVCCVMKTTGDE